MSRFSSRFSSSLSSRFGGGGGSSGSAFYPIVGFANGAGFLANDVTFTRSSSATYFDSTGTMQTVATNTPRYNYNESTLAYEGLLIEGARTNSLRNSTMQGVVAGTPGTDPTNWLYTGGSALTKTIVGTGTSKGMTYIDVRISGTPSATSGHSYRTEASTQIAALVGQVWTASVYVAIVGGSTTNVGLVRLNIQEKDNAGVTLANTNGSSFLSSLTASLQRFVVTRTFDQATTAYTTSSLELTYTNGSAIDITLRIAAPQLELGSFESTFIPTTSAAVTRSADVATVANVNTRSWSNPTEYSVAVEYKTPVVASSGTQRVFQFHDGTSNNRLSIIANNSGQITYAVVTGGVSQVSSNLRASTTSMTKNAVACKVNDFAGVADGGTVQTDSSGTVPTVTTLAIGNNGYDSSAPLFGTIKSLTYYRSRLPNATLQAITT